MLSKCSKKPNGGRPPQVILEHVQSGHEARIKKERILPFIAANGTFLKTVTDFVFKADLAKCINLNEIRSSFLR